jgi:hypothetical protein
MRVLFKNRFIKNLSNKSIVKNTLEKSEQFFRKNQKLSQNLLRKNYETIKYCIKS